MKTVNKKIFLMLILFLVIISFTIYTYAWTIDQFNPSSTSVTGTEEIKTFGNNIVSVITTIGIVASVIILIIIGLRYMLGSIEEKAQYKKSMIPYIIGAGLVFTASFIANIIYDWAINL